METFTPSLDWGDELIASALWVAKAWTVAAVGMVVVLALLGRFTIWGRQFWRITGDYFKGRESIPVWALLGVLLLSVMIDVRLGVLFSYQSNDQFSALQAAFQGQGSAKDAAITGFWFSILILAGLIIADIVRTVLDTYLTQRFIIRWRVWLTRRVTGDWLDGDAYYRGTVRRRSDRQSGPAHPAGHRHLHRRHRPGNQHADGRYRPNAGIRHRLRHRIVVSFTPILWDLAGPLTLFGVTVPKALFWMALVYVFFTTVVAFWIGRPLIRLSFSNETHQRGVPLCVGSAARCGRGRRPLSRRMGRTQPADRQIRGRHRPTTGPSSAGALHSSAGTGR